MLCLGHLCKKHRVRKVAVASVMHLIDFIHDTLCTRIKMLSPRVGGGGGRATHGKLTERAFPRVGNLTWPPSWKTERNWK